MNEICPQIDQTKVLPNGLSNELLGQALRSFPDPIFVFDRAGRYLTVLGCADAKWLIGDANCVGKLMIDVLPAEKVVSFLAEIERALSERRTVRYRYRLNCEDVSGLKAVPAQTNVMYFEANITPIIEGDTPPDKVIWIANNVTDFVHEVAARERVAERLAEQAARDALTGLFNRRGFASEVLTRLERAKGTGFALALADLDHFKQLNDRYGHPAGDQALKVAARRLRAALRPGDLIGRWGGEEFVIWLDRVTETNAFMACERMRRALCDMAMNHEGETIRVSASIGLAMVDEANPNLDSLINRADQALYAAKRAGRNRVVINDPELVDLV